MISNGIDIVKINRMENLINDENFLNKVFTSNEINYLNKHKRWQTMAGMYAAKEAFSKAISQGLSYNYKNIEIIHLESGKPILNIIKKDIDFKDIALSISHDGDYAVAIVTILF